ncbi:10372_t:CDS:2, partial [Acaulospora colombiana]
SKKDQAEEIESMQNDRSLYKLIHTKLLSASLDGPSEGDGAKRKKSLEGRVLELSKNAKLGKGETDVRRAEHNKAPRHIREGIVAKQKEKREKQLQEVRYASNTCDCSLIPCQAKDLGNYHPTIKRLLSDPDKVSRPKKRERGLGMGIGSFRGGVLTLGKQDIQRGQGTPSFKSKGGGKRSSRR